MNKDVYLEVNASQKPAIELFQAMGYTYISQEDCEKQRGSKYKVLLKVQQVFLLRIPPLTCFAY